MERIVINSLSFFLVEKDKQVEANSIQAKTKGHRKFPMPFCFVKIYFLISL